MGPPLDPLEDPLLEPLPELETPELETPLELETPELETPLLEDPLLEPPVPGGSVPTLGSTRPMQPAIDRPAKQHRRHAVRETEGKRHTPQPQQLACQSAIPRKATNCAVLGDLGVPK